MAGKSEPFDLSKLTTKLPSRMKPHPQGKLLKENIDWAEWEKWKKKKKVQIKLEKGYKKIQEEDAILSNTFELFG